MIQAKLDMQRSRGVHEGMEKADRDTEITSSYLYERGRLISNDNRPCVQGARCEEQQLIVVLVSGIHYIVGY